MSLLTDTDRRIIDGFRGGVCTGPGPCDTTPIGEGKNWVTEVDGLPLYIRAIAQALLRSGHSESQAIQLAVGTVKRWAAGGGKVTAETRARAAKAVAEWEAKKAAAHGSRDAGPAGVVTEGGSAGSLLPVGPSPAQAAKVVATEMHAFRGADLQHCAVCGQPYSAAVHLSKRAKGVRAVGAYAAGHAFFGNQYSADAQAGATPAQLQLLAEAMNKVSGLPSGGHGSKGASKGGSKGGAGGKKGGTGAKASKHAAAVKKAAAKKSQSQVSQYLHTLARATNAANTAKAKAAAWRAKAAHAATPKAKASFEAKAAAYEQAAVQLENVVAKLSGHRSDTGVRHAGDGHDRVPTGHVKGNPARARLAHKHRFVADADRLEGQLHTAMSGLFDRQEKTTLSRLSGGRGRTIRRLTTGQRADQPADNTPPDGQPADVASIFDAAYWADQTAQTVSPIVQEAALQAADRVAGMLALDPPDRSSLEQLFQVLADRSNRLAGQVTQTTFAQIQQAVSDGLAGGENIGQIADRVRNVFAVARTRAELIARTEAVGSLNQAANTYATGLPAGTVGRKEWLAVHDARTRMTHRVADGQSVPLSMPFVVGGSLMMHPGDPTAPPDEVCNCFPADVEVDAPGILGTTRRRYSGPMVRLSTRGGTTVRCTPNHPILTLDGWKTAQTLRSGDYLVRAGLLKDASVRDPQVHDVPTTFGQIVDPLHEVGAASRMVVGPVDFHGDVPGSWPYGDVDVVRTYGDLMPRNKAIVDKVLAKFDLTLTDPGGSEHVFAGTLDRPFSNESRIVPLPPPAGMSERRETRSLCGGRAPHPGEHSGGTVATLNALFAEYSADDLTTDPIRLSDGLLALTSEVTLDEVATVDVGPFTGHVYNLQTTTGWYVANGIVAHNCRCTVLYLPGHAGTAATAAQIGDKAA